jgi:transcriptional regulator with XRE-family HTH domain
MTTIRDLRASAQVTQVALASAGGTSQPTVAAYESGAKSPTLRTIERLAASVGRQAVVVYVTPLTREDRRSLFLHRRIADKLRADSEDVLRIAGQNLALMTERHPGAQILLTEWADILERPVEAIVDAMLSPGIHARDLRQVTPFAGVLSASERSDVYSRFSRSESRR